LACVRDVDTVARLGGDEFAIVFSGITNPADATRTAEKIIQKLSEPMMLQNGHECGVGASIGIAIYPENGAEIDRLMSAADNAMYESKNSGKNNYTLSRVQAHCDLDDQHWIDLDKAHLFGIAEIDQEHLALANVLNELNAAVRGNQPAEVTSRLFDTFSEQIRSHFKNEDRLMDQYDFFDNGGHKNEHQRLIDELDYFKKKLNHGGEMVVLQSLKDWLLNHISNMDRELAEFIAQRGLR